MIGGMSTRPIVPVDPSQPIGLVLSGGGARGAFQIGVWEVLRRDPRGLGADPAVVSGTSAGAINGALIAAGLSPDQMMEFWLDLAKSPPVTANERLFRSLRNNVARVLVTEPLRPLRRRLRGARVAFQFAREHHVLRPSGLLALGLEMMMTARYDNISAILDGVDTAFAFSTARFRDRLVAAIGGDRLPPTTRVALAINTVDVRTGRVVRFVNRAPGKRAQSDDSHYRVHDSITVDMVLASASIPLLFNPVEVDGYELWDGGVLVNTPLAPAIALGARRLVPVLVNAGLDASGERPLHLGTAVERLADAFLENAYNADRKLLLIRNELARVAPASEGLSVVELYEPIRPRSSRLFNAGSYLYFERDALLRMYDAGREAARAWLARGPRLDGPVAHGHVGDPPT